ncbi:unnamed protein product, partial [Prorocentrum cordatum]
MTCHVRGKASGRSLPAYGPLIRRKKSSRALIKCGSGGPQPRPDQLLILARPLARMRSKRRGRRGARREEEEEEEEEEAEAEEEDRTSHRSSACRRQARRGPLGPLRTPEGGGGSAQQKAGERGGARSQPGRAWPASHCCYAYATFAAPEAPQGGPSADPRNPR